MEANILQIVGTALALVTVLISVKRLRKKVRSREVLLRHLSENAEFRRELKAFQEAHDSVELRQEIKRINELIQEQLALLDPSDRERIEPSLYQSSPTGRARFVEKLASDASQLQHAGVH